MLSDGTVKALKNFNLTKQTYANSHQLYLTYLKLFLLCPSLPRPGGGARVLGTWAEELLAPPPPQKMCLSPSSQRVRAEAPAAKHFLVHFLQMFSLFCLWSIQQLWSLYVTVYSWQLDTTKINTRLQSESQVERDKETANAWKRQRGKWLVDEVVSLDWDWD